MSLALCGNYAVEVSIQLYYHKEDCNMLKPLACQHEMLLFHVLHNILSMLCNHITFYNLLN
jgi:hypothetical protein